MNETRTNTVGKARFSGRSIQLSTGDGFRLHGRLFEPEHGARATFLALPGIGVAQRAFRHVGVWMAERGLRLVSVDYRGIGESDNPAARRAASLSAWARQDAVAALRFVREQLGTTPTLLAHSFGGQALGLCDELHDIAGAVLVGSQLGHRRHWSGFDRVKLELFWRVLLPLGERLSDPIPKWVVGAPLPVGVARQWRRWGQCEDWLFGEMPEAEERFANFSKPILAYGVSDDVIAPPRAVSALLERFTTAEVTRVDVHPRELARTTIGHMGLLRPHGTAAIWERWRQFALSQAAKHVESPLETEQSHRVREARRRTA